MTPVEIYLYSNCSSCKKAESALIDAHVDLVRRDVFKERLTPVELTGVLKRIGLSAFDVLSTCSIRFRELELANREVTETELIDLMSQNPGLLKRPIIIAGNNYRVGFNKSAIDQLIAGLN